MAWQRMFFRGDPVLVHVDDDGKPVLDGGGRAEMKYRESDTKSYRPGLVNLTLVPGSAARETTPIDQPPAVVAARPRPSARTSAVPAARGKRAKADGTSLAVWTDGACSGNPGPMGIGVVVIHGAGRDEVGEYLGSGTNNIAELVAIERGLELATQRLGPDTRRVLIHSDSSYAIGLLEKGWKAKANAELVARIRRKLVAFPIATEFVKVAGHAGVVENERCDELARMAIVSRRSVP